MTDTTMERQEVAEDQMERRARYGGTDLFRGVLVLVIAAAVGILLVSQAPSSPRFLADGEDEGADAVAGPAVDGEDEDSGVDVTGSTALGADSADADATGSAMVGSDGAGSDSAVAGGADTGTEDEAASSDIFPDDGEGDAMADGEAVADGANGGLAEVTVVVLNHTGQKGIAGAEADKLEAAGYGMLPAANAATSSGSGIYYRSGFEDQAKALAITMGLTTAGLVKPMADSGAPTASGRDISSANIIVVLGKDGFLPVN